MTAGALPRIQLSRRALIAGMAVAAPAAIVGCASQSQSAAKPTRKDLAIVRLLASLEVNAISAYRAIIDGLLSGQLGAAPDALLTFFKTARAHHQEHEQVWNQVLTRAGVAPQVASDPPVDADLKQDLRNTTRIGDTMAVGRKVELILAHTTGQLAPEFGPPDLVRLAARIAPVENQHLGILQYLSGADLVQEWHVVYDLARTPSDLGKF